MHKWISFPHREGVCSKQAHADFPEEAIYEREAGRSGFFGPAAHFHHQHAPTGWSEWEGDLRPRADNGAKDNAYRNVERQWRHVRPHHPSDKKHRRKHDHDCDRRH